MVINKNMYIDRLPSDLSAKIYRTPLPFPLSVELRILKHRKTTKLLGHMTSCKGRACVQKAVFGLCQYGSNGKGS